MISAHTIHAVDKICSSPIGNIRVSAVPIGDGWGISAITVLLPDLQHTSSPDGMSASSYSTGVMDLLLAAEKQLEAFFAGRLHKFDLPLAPAVTHFQARLREAMTAIPYGHTATYAGLAREIGSSPRAVGTGCGRNPIPIIIPCHRVLASTGIGGYSGGEGLQTKRGLLAIERAGLKHI
jgi:methylated-DNA-[protein]-cysteine S-methyltransferase